MVGTANVVHGVEMPNGPRLDVDPEASGSSGVGGSASREGHGIQHSVLASQTAPGMLPGCAKSDQKGGLHLDKDATGEQYLRHVRSCV